MKYLFAKISLLSMNLLLLAFLAVQGLNLLYEIKGLKSVDWGVNFVAFVLWSGTASAILTAEERG